MPFSMIPDSVADAAMMPDTSPVGRFRGNVKKSHSIAQGTNPISRWCRIASTRISSRGTT